MASEWKPINTAPKDGRLVRLRREGTEAVGFWLINIGAENIRGAWQLDKLGMQHPVAVLPTNIHPRMSVQRSCFTVHGKNKNGLADQVPSLLRRYEIDPDKRDDFRKDLRLLGISRSTVWPDLDGLAKELGELY